MSSAKRTHPNVFTVPSGAPFLPVLADALLAGTLVPLPGGDPLSLAAVTVLLPTRRSVRALRETLIARLGGEAAILPTIRPIGDVDEEDHLLDPGAAEAGAEKLALPVAIDALSRRLALTRLTLAFAGGLRAHALALRPGEPQLVPASAADAVRLSGDLARLIDDMQTAGVPWGALRTLAPEDHAEYFQLTLKFLSIVTEQWPRYLAGLGRVDPASRRDTLIRAAAARLGAYGSPGPIIAAGSTGSIPATAELLRQVARLPNGAVVLPGLDQGLDEAGWAAIGEEETAAAAHGHPQFGLKTLVGKLGVTRDGVTPLAEAPNAARTRILSEAMRPAETLDAWAGFVLPAGALDGLDLIVARNEQEEATAIALAIREALEKPGVAAALVTPDRTLARRVAAELRRWQLEVDDSAGAPLGHEPHGVFARLVAEAAAFDAEPVKILSLAKHRFASFGLSHQACAQAARTLELALFRGRRVTGGVAGLRPALEKARDEARTEKHAPRARRNLGPKQWDLAFDLVDRIADCLGPLEAAVRGSAPVSARQMAGIVRDALRKAAMDENGKDAAFWQGDGGTALANLIGALIEDEEATQLLLAPADVPYFFAALLGDVAVQRPVSGDPRVHIWGTLEARLQSVDCLILGGLDEGIWPTESRTDPWLSRPMRAAMKLLPPERRIGLAAHDFLQGAAVARVLITRADKRGGAPTVESRWLQRLRSLVGKDAAEAMTARGMRYVQLARDLGAAPDKPAPAKRPEPTPPLAARPMRLSITEIEKLIRDPYAIYARHILRLDPLDPLGRPPDASLRGTLTHDALGNFALAWNSPYTVPEVEAALVGMGREELAKIADFPDVHAVWLLRFGVIARWYAGWEVARSESVERRFAEIDGKLVVPTPAGDFTLTGRADRIDIMRNGTLEIYDYKTGSPQTDRTVFAGLTPQMTLEAAMARAGGFADIPSGLSVQQLAWLAVGRAGRDDPYVNAVVKRDGLTADQLADRAQEMFAELVGKFALEGHPYRSRARPMMENNKRYLGDYDHLARVREWGLVESEADLLGGGGDQG